MIHFDTGTQTYEPLSSHLAFWTDFAFPAQNNEEKMLI